MKSFSDAALDLLRELDADNTTDWYRRHRSDVERLLREPTADFLASASGDLQHGERPMSGGARTLLGQRRDTRFAPVRFHTTVRGLLSRHGERLASPLGALLTTTNDSPAPSGTRLPRGVFGMARTSSLLSNPL
jgi:uncharacterized protein (DUF2461 family)